MLKILTFCLSVLFLINICESSEVALKNLKFYGYFNGGERGSVLYMNDKKIEIQPGDQKRLEFQNYKYLDGVAPKIIDIEVTILNKSEETFRNVEISCYIYPKVASFIFVKDDDHSLLDEEEITKHAKWSNSVLCKSEKISSIKPNKIEKISFDKIELGQLIESYTKKKQWPIFFKVKIIVKSESVPEKSIYRIMKIPIPPY